MGAAAGAGSPPGAGASREAQRGSVLSYTLGETSSLAPIFLPALTRLECSKLRLTLMPRLKTRAPSPRRSLDRLQEWESLREEGVWREGWRAPHPCCFTLTAPSRGFRMTLRAWPWGEPTASAQTSSDSGQGSAGACVLGVLREPAVEPLTSFQSLPFINIYSSPATKIGRAHV